MRTIWLMFAERTSDIVRLLIDLMGSKRSFWMKRGVNADRMRRRRTVDISPPVTTWEDTGLTVRL